MAQNYDDISELANILRCHGDKVLDASSKLSLSASFISKLNASWSYFCKQKDSRSGTSDCITDSLRGVLDLQFLYDFIQKTIALKILPDLDSFVEPCLVDLHLFNNLRLLEINHLSLNFVKGLKALRSHLEYITCSRSLCNLNDVLEYCGADRAQGYVWTHLKKAVFSYNHLTALDTSLEFIPKIEMLDLSHNNLTDAHMISCLPSLSNLNLSYNRLESFPSFHGSLSNSLISLSLHSNFIEDLQELSSLVNLQKLDLSRNCLLNHSSLAPLSCLPNLKWLNLLGNPLCVHPCHRILTIHYLHPEVSSNFILDHMNLTNSEKRNVTSEFYIEPSVNRSSSFSSEITESTIIIKDTQPVFQRSSVETNEDMESDTSKSISVASASLDENFSTNPVDNNDTCRHLPSTITDENVQMQDSGFFAGTRPISRSQSSIGSATSLFSNDVEVHDTLNESDIEVLTNPSQSSIEVLERDSRDIRF